MPEVVSESGRPAECLVTLSEEMAGLVACRGVAGDCMAVDEGNEDHNEGNPDEKAEKSSTERETGILPGPAGRSKIECESSPCALSRCGVEIGVAP